MMGKRPILREAAGPFSRPVFNPKGATKLLRAAMSARIHHGILPNMRLKAFFR
jgi:hypothetical protein